MCAYLRIRFERTRDQSDIDLAVNIGRLTVEELDPGSPFRALFLTNLGGSLLQRHYHSQRSEDLDEAVTAQSEAVSAARPGHPDQPLFLMNLALTLDQRFHRTGELDTPGSGRNCQEAAGRTPPEHPSRPMDPSNLSTCLDSLATETEDRR